MALNAILFIDGNNFYHNLKKIRISPNEVDFYKLANLIEKHFNVNFRKVIYYNSIPDIRDGEEMYYKHIKFLRELQNIPKFEIKTRKLQKQSMQEILQDRKKKIDTLILCDKCKLIIEKHCFECIGEVKKKEKGIDVMIAVDMVNNALNNKCEFCVLLSGDADFIPAMNLITEIGKKTASVSVPKGYSSELRSKFPFFVLNDEAITENCLKS